MTKFINMGHVRREDQKKVMEKIAEENHCPFCSENLTTYHKKPILKEGKFWWFTDNQWPYEKIKHQLLAVYKKHIEHIKDLEPGAGEELMQFFAEESVRRNIPGGGLAMRFGTNPEHGNYGSTVYHLHAHLIEPDLDALGESEAWKFKFGEPKNYKKAK